MIKKLITLLFLFNICQAQFLPTPQFGFNKPQGAVTPPPASDLLTDLISYYSMEGNANDVYSTHEGTPGAVAFGNSYGKITQGAWYQFGSSSYTTIVNDAQLRPAVFTVNSWINFSTGYTHSIFQSSEQAGNFAGFVFRVGADDKVLILAGNNTDLTLGSGYDYAASTTSVADNTWHMVTGKYDGSDLKIYVDGVLESTEPYTGMVYALTNKVSIGYYRYGAADTYNANGYIDELGFWSRVLTDAEILELYNSGTGKAYPF